MDIHYCEREKSKFSFFFGRYFDSFRFIPIKHHFEHNRAYVWGATDHKLGDKEKSLVELNVCFCCFGFSFHLFLLVVSWLSRITQKEIISIERIKL